MPLTTQFLVNVVLSVSVLLSKPLCGIVPCQMILSALCKVSRSRQLHSTEAIKI